MKNLYLKAIGVLLVSIALLTGIIYFIGQVPEIKDREIHSLSSTHIDTAAFNRDAPHAREKLGAVRPTL